MKSASDPRHILRRKIVKELFSSSFSSQDVTDNTKKILKKLPEIDELIRESAPQWEIDKINKVDLAVLRLATWEITKAKTPAKAIIDEAIELAKEYGSEGSPSFVNGVLGTILKKHAKNK